MPPPLLILDHGGEGHRHLGRGGPLTRRCRLRSRILVQLAGSVCSSVRRSQHLAFALTRLIPDLTPLVDHRPFELRKDAHYPESALPANEEVNLFRVYLREQIGHV